LIRGQRSRVFGESVNQRIYIPRHEQRLDVSYKSPARFDGARIAVVRFRHACCCHLILPEAGASPKTETGECSGEVGDPEGVEEQRVGRVELPPDLAERRRSRYPSWCRRWVSREPSHPTSV